MCSVEHLLCSVHYKPLQRKQKKKRGDKIDSEKNQYKCILHIINQIAILNM